MAVHTRTGQEGLLCDAIVAEIEQTVISGEVGPGDGLPSERELGEKFGVSRTVVREAIKVLSDRHLVTVMRGKGAIVAHPSSRAVSVPLSLLLRLGKATAAQVIELRRAIEPETASLAALRATPEQIKSLQQVANAHRAVIDDTEESVSLDLAFHRLVAEAAHNEAILVVVDSIQDLYRTSMITRYGSDNLKESTLYLHGQVARAVAERDPEAARLFMREHLDRLAFRWRDLSPTPASQGLIMPVPSPRVPKGASD